MTAEELEDQPGRQLSGTPIVVGERPMVFWDVDHVRTQAQFLLSIDPGFFTYLLQTHQDQIGSANDLHAAMALRLSYAHALESLLALIGAAVQAPHCPAGWLLKYQNAELTWLIGRITEREPFHNKLNLDGGNWEMVSDRLFPWSLSDDSQVEHRAAAARLWRFLAKEYLDKDLTYEYNSLKHGLRVRAGGWYFAMGLEDQPGVPAPRERMRVMSQSDYGSSFLRPIQIKTRQHAVEEQRVNWSPRDMLKRLPLIVDSIGNVVVFLKEVNDVPLDDARVSMFKDVAVGQALAAESHGTSFRFATRSGIQEQAIADLTAQQILATYLSAAEDDGPDRASTAEPSVG